METSLTKFKLSHKIRDDAFNVESIPRYHLSLQLGSENFRFCIVDIPGGRCVWMEDYRFSSTLFFTEQVLDQLNLIYDDHHILQAGFWKTITVAFKNYKFTLVPRPLFRPELAHQYLQLSAEVATEQEDTLQHAHAGYDLVNIFSVEKRITDWFQDAYPAKSVSFVHYTSAFMEGVQPHATEDNGNVFVLVEHTHLTIVVMHPKQLRYCNTFAYQSVPDFVYFVMLVMNELQLNPDTCPVTLYGEISHDSAIFNNLYKYIRHVSFGTKPPALKFSYAFDELLDHRYFDLYAIHRC